MTKNNPYSEYSKITAAYNQQDYRNPEEKAYQAGQIQILQELMEEVETLSTGALDTEIGIVVDLNQVKDRINQKIEEIEK